MSNQRTVHIIRKPIEDDCLRASIGGSEELGGYYLTYRGDRLAIARMLATVLSGLVRYNGSKEYPFDLPGMSFGAVDEVTITTHEIT